MSEREAWVGDERDYVGLQAEVDRVWLEAEAHRSDIIVLMSSAQNGDEDLLEFLGGSKNFSYLIFNLGSLVLAQIDLNKRSRLGDEAGE